MKIQIEVIVSDDPKFCLDCNYFEFYPATDYGNDEAWCNLFYESYDAPETLDYDAESRKWMKCQQCIDKCSSSSSKNLWKKLTKQEMNEKLYKFL